MKRVATVIAIVWVSAMAGFGQKTTWKVEHSGAMREMFQTGNIGGKVAIGKLAPQPYLYGLGPLENLAGEIMLWNGEPLTSFVKDKAVIAETNPQAKAVFFVWAQVEEWRVVAIPKRVQTYGQLEKFIAAAAEKVDINAAEPFPFLLKGKFPAVAWHVNNYQPDGAGLTHEKHDAMKFKGKSRQARLEMLGFYSPKHQGVFTHHARTSHIHATDKKRSFVGHVDDLRVNGRCQLFLPQVKK